MEEDFTVNEVEVDFSKKKISGHSKQTLKYYFFKLWPNGVGIAPDNSKINSIRNLLPKDTIPF